MPAKHVDRDLFAALQFEHFMLETQIPWNGSHSADWTKLEFSPQQLLHAYSLVVPLLPASNIYHTAMNTAKINAVKKFLTASTTTESAESVQFIVSCGVFIRQMMGFYAGVKWSTMANDLQVMRDILTSSPVL